MIDPREAQEDYQQALAWVGEQVKALERQGLTLDHLGGWHRFRPDRKALERAWRVLYHVPATTTRLMTSPQWQWEGVILVWMRWCIREPSIRI